MSFLKEYLFEVNQYPKFEIDGGQLMTIKDYFFFDSNTDEYGYRGLVVPTSIFLNKEEVPDESTIRYLINNNIPAIKRSVDSDKMLEYWSFHPSKIEELKNV